MWRFYSQRGQAVFQGRLVVGTSTSDRLFRRILSVLALAVMVACSSPTEDIAADATSDAVADALVDEGSEITDRPVLYGWDLTDGLHVVSTQAAQLLGPVRAGFCPEPVVTYLTQIASPEDYGLLQGEGTDLKYLAPVEGQPPREPLVEPCYFQNTHLYPWHIQFLNSFPELADLTFDEYVALMLYAETRIWWGGSLQIWPSVTHPSTDRRGIISFTIYSAPDEATGLTVEDAVDVHDTLQDCMPYGGDLLVFVPVGLPQEDMVRLNRQDLADQGVAALLPAELAQGMLFIPYSLGEGYGILHIVPRGSPLEDYGPREVVVVESAPNDIAIVAGLLTANPQSLHSHVNLRLQEKQIPNAAIPDIYDNELVTSLAGSLVHLVVSELEVLIEPARLEDAEAFWESRIPDVGPVQSDLSVTDIRSFAQLTHQDAIAYGAKAANLGELFDILAEEHRVDGLAIPFAYYQEFIEQNDIDVQIQSFLDNPLSRTDADFRRAGLDDIRRSIRNGVMDPDFFVLLQDRLVEVLSDDIATTPLKFRSSTNVEDLDEFTGAGLYNSRRGCLADDLDGDGMGPSACLSPEETVYLRTLLITRLVEAAEHPERVWLDDIIEDLQGDLSDEKTIARAIRRVWASLWNDQAFEEREYYGVDHLDAFMGIAVNPSFVVERVNAVAITNVGAAEDLPLYRILSQVGWESVVQPADPTAVPEALTFRRQGEPPEMVDLQWLVNSSLVDEGERLWSNDHLETLAQLLFEIQDHFGAEVYPELEPLRLDLEAKISWDGRVVIKQVRPYVGGVP